MWMSHGDKLHKVPEGFKAVGTLFSCFCVIIIVGLCMLILEGIDFVISQY